MTSYYKYLYKKILEKYNVINIHYYKWSRKIMGYELLASNSNGGGDRQLHIHLYPNTTVDDSMVGTTGIAYDGATSFGEQLINADVLSSYYIWASYEHPGLTPNDDAKNTWDDWTSYDGPNNKLDITGSHVLLYQISTSMSNGYADGVNSGSGAFDNSTACAVAVSSSSPKAMDRQTVIHEIGHTCIVDDPGVNEGLGDTNYNDTLDHELGKVYPGALGDGPISPMSSGYEDGEGREGDCSNDAPWNKSYDESLTSCTKKAIKRTSNNY